MSAIAISLRPRIQAGVPDTSTNVVSVQLGPRMRAEVTPAGAIQLLELQVGPAMRGPAGPPGTGGAAPITYPINGVAAFQQAHTFPYYPDATILDEDGQVVDADVFYSAGLVSVVFSQPFTGSLLLR